MVNSLSIRFQTLVFGVMNYALNGRKEIQQDCSCSSSNLPASGGTAGRPPRPYHGAAEFAANAAICCESKAGDLPEKVSLDPQGKHFGAGAGVVERELRYYRQGTPIVVSTHCLIKNWVSCQHTNLGRVSLPQKMVFERTTTVEPAPRKHHQEMQKKNALSILGVL